MLEEIVLEIEEMEYPSGEIFQGLIAEGIHDRGAAAAHGFGEAQERIMAIIRSHSNDGWTYCGDGKNLPEEPGDGLRDMDELEEYIVMIEDAEVPTVLEYAGGGEWHRDGVFYSVIAWQPLPSPYRPQKAVGDDYKNRIMDRFLRTE